MIYIDPIFQNIQKCVDGSSFCCVPASNQAKTLNGLLEKAIENTKKSKLSIHRWFINLEFNSEAVDILFAGCNKYSNSTPVVTNVSIQEYIKIIDC